MMISSHNQYVSVVKNMTQDDVKILDEVFSKSNDLALDVEGVDLGRRGDVSLVTIATRDNECYLFDILDCKTPDDTEIKFLKTLLEDACKKKIIHDCRMDSDALWHIACIQIKNVHDTSCFHTVTEAEQEVNLNNLLKFHKIEANVVRDGNVYRQNHAFWAKRPLTEKMITWAANDVVKLFQVHDLQIQRAQDKNKLPQCLTMSKEYCTLPCLLSVEEISITNPGKFIGRSGSNINSLRARTNTCIYPRGPRHENKMLVYYKNERDLQQVQRAARDV